MSGNGKSLLRIYITSNYHYRHFQLSTYIAMASGFARAVFLGVMSAGFLLSGCASGDGVTDGARNSDRASLTWETIRDAEIAGTAYDVVMRLRPAWLHRRGRQPIRVYLDDSAFGASEEALSRISAASVRRIERLDGPQATGRFGRGHSGGAILVWTL